LRAASQPTTRKAEYIVMIAVIAIVVCYCLKATRHTNYTIFSRLSVCILSILGLSSCGHSSAMQAIIGRPDSLALTE